MHAACSGIFWEEWWHFSAISFFHERASASPGGQLPTCSHAAQCHQPPLRHPGQHHGHAVPTLQAACSREDIGRPLAELLQLPEVPAHLLPAAAHPPQGRARGSPAGLREGEACWWGAGGGLGHSLGKVLVESFLISGPIVTLKKYFKNLKEFLFLWILSINISIRIFKIVVLHISSVVNTGKVR